jgi:tetratricopeptide (TPR) repeat protein
MHNPRALLVRLACLGFVAALLLDAPRAVALPRGSAAAPEDSIYTLAGQLYATKRYMEAIPLFEEVIALNPRFANAYALLGSSFLHLGIYEKAIANFEKALKLDEGIKLAYLGLVVANYYTSKIEAAQKWARKCLPVLSPGEKNRWLAMFQKKFPELGVGLTSIRRAGRQG